MIVVVPTWLTIGLALCWIPALIAHKKREPVWVWVLFGIVCLPAAVVFSLLEKPAVERAF